jgi:hypothetical protein
MKKGPENVAQEIRPAAEREGHQLSHASAHGCHKRDALTCSVLQSVFEGIAWEAARQVRGCTQQGLNAFLSAALAVRWAVWVVLSDATGGVSTVGVRVRA